jgi:hypothetical protein
MNNLKKFGSIDDFYTYRATDGWSYPSVCVVDDENSSEAHYNDELRMRWYDKDTAKTPTFYGEITQDEFKTWVDSTCFPCEIKKDGTDFAYLKTGTGTAMSDWSKRANSAASHYNTTDKLDYLQMVELQNVNVGLFHNASEGWNEIRFNFDTGCPSGFHKWFAHPYWNSTKVNPITGQTGVWTKLMARYDSSSSGTSTDAASMTNVAFGTAQATSTDPFSATSLLALNTKTNSNLLEITYWEQLVLSYIFCAYFKTFNSQSIYGGLISGTSDYTWTSGQTDTLLTHFGQLGNNMGYRFMHMENPIHGKQAIWTSGCTTTRISANKLVKTCLSYDDQVSNSAVILTLDNSDVVESLDYSVITSPDGYVNNVNLWGFNNSNTTGGSSSLGFYDKQYTEYNQGDGDYCMAAGGNSADGAGCGAFWRGGFLSTSTNAAIRGRATLIR